MHTRLYCEIILGGNIDDNFDFSGLKYSYLLQFQVAAKHSKVHATKVKKSQSSIARLCQYKTFLYFYFINYCK